MGKVASNLSHGQPVLKSVPPRLPAVRTCPKCTHAITIHIAHSNGVLECGIKPLPLPDSPLERVMR